MEDHSSTSISQKWCLANANPERFFGSEMATLEHVSKDLIRNTVNQPVR